MVDLINSSHIERCASTGMQVLDENSTVFFNFINSLDSEYTKDSNRFCLEKFLNHYDIDLVSFLKLPQEEMTTLIIKYLVDKKISRRYKSLVTASIKHACEINDVVLNWKKIKKFINSEKSGNEIKGRDRGYTHEEIRKFYKQIIEDYVYIVRSIIPADVIDDHFRLYCDRIEQIKDA